MNKEIKIHYPKRRTQKKEDKQLGIQPPVRKNMYEVLLENFKVAKRATFLHRIIYIGEHFFPPNGEMIKQCFASSINIVNESECIEQLTGFLIYYNRYFIHLVEGDEDSLNAHIGLLLKNEKFKHHSKVVKLLIHISHINQRLIINWNSYSGVPSRLLGEIDPNCTLEDSGRHTFNCIKKVYATVNMFVEDNYSSDTRLTEVSNILMRDSVVTSLVNQDTRLSVRSSSYFPRASSLVGSNPYRSNLPEIEVLDFLIKSNFTEHLSNYYSKYGVVPQRDIYKDKVWPVPSDFVPYDIFTKLYQNVTELPKPKPVMGQAETTIEDIKKKDGESDQRKSENPEQGQAVD